MSDLAPAAAFFRNLNLGQARTRSPGRDELVGAFEASGAPGVDLVRGNGTVLFTATDPDACVRSVAARLGAGCGWSDAVLVRGADWLRRLDLDGLGERVELAVFDRPAPLPWAPPWRPERGRATVVRADRGHAWVDNDEPGTSYATPVLESALGVPVTSRGIGTVRLLLRRLGPG